MNFQRLLQVWLRARGSDRGSPYTVEEAARLFGVQPFILEGWLNGKIKPGASDADWLGQILGLSPVTVKGAILHD